MRFALDRSKEDDLRDRADRLRRRLDRARHRNDAVYFDALVQRALDSVEQR